MSVCLISLGANLGDRAETLERAVAQLASRPAIHVTACSRWHETQPVGGPAGQPAFLNGALLLETSVGPFELLARLHEIESNLGRTRGKRWDARSIDLDLLLFDGLVLDTGELTLPHPRMSYRRFVLESAAEVAPAMVHPLIGWTISQLLAHLNQSPEYVAMAGPFAPGKRKLADEVLQCVPGRRIPDPFEAAPLAAFGPNPAGPVWSRAIEFLRRQKELLSAERWISSDDVTISDFWFGETLAYAEVWLTSEECGAFKELWHNAAREVVQPKLIVALDATATSLRAWLDRLKPGPLDDAMLNRFREAMTMQVAMPAKGPTLRLKADQPGLREEVVAAIHAMR